MHLGQGHPAAQCQLGLALAPGYLIMELLCLFYTNLGHVLNILVTAIFEGAFAT